VKSKYKPYPSYKESGVEWLGEIPEGWEARRLGYYFSERKEKVSDKDFQALSVTKNGIVPQLENAAKTDDGDNRKKVCADDFVINSRSDRKGSSGLSQLTGSVSLINTVIVPKTINGRYTHHLLRSYPFQEEFYRYGKGIVADLWSTNYTSMKNIIIPYPPLQEQKAIASYLDRATQKIDTLITKQEQLITLLKEKRQALISRAVTKGVDGNGKLRMENGEFKDSGVEWLGKIPRWWEIKKLKYILSLQTKKVSIKKQKVIALENIESWSGKIVKTQSNYQGEDVEFQQDDILFGKLRPYLAKVYQCKEKGIAFGDILTYRPNIETASKFAFYAMLSEIFINIVDSSTYGSKMPRASVEFVNNMPIPLPPKEEQKAIATYLDQKTQAIDTLIDKATKSIELLKEKRTALISAVVTGKVDVRDIHD